MAGSVCPIAGRKRCSVHREPGFVVVADGGAAVPAGFPKNRKKLLLGFSTNDVLLPVSASR
jgi:hypothetical protein